jgi:hypothetical protein
MKEADMTKLSSTSNKTQRGSFFMSSAASYLLPEDWYFPGVGAATLLLTQHSVLLGVIPITETSSTMLSPTRRGSLVILRS